MERGDGEGQGGREEDEEEREEEEKEEDANCANGGPQIRERSKERVIIVHPLFLSFPLSPLNCRRLCIATAALPIKRTTPVPPRAASSQPLRAPAPDSPIIFVTRIPRSARREVARSPKFLS